MAKSKEPEISELTDLDLLLLLRIYHESNFKGKNGIRAARAVNLEYKPHGKLQGQIPRLVEHDLITINNTWCRLTQQGLFKAASIWRQIHYKVFQNLD